MSSRWIFRVALLGVVLLALVFRPEPAAKAAPIKPAPGLEQTRVLPPDHARRTGTMTTGVVVIPVAGVKRSDLIDTWNAPRGNGRRHEAIDILAERGTPALAAVDGTILKFFESKAGGLTLYLADPTGRVVYYYAHLDGYAGGLKEGDRVTRGQIIGYVGTTGNAPANAPHLHFAWEQLPPSGEWWKGVPQNPYPLLSEQGETIDRQAALSLAD
jgi:peptidoglycan LD-endopeptidase LytH